MPDSNFEAKRPFKLTFTLCATDPRIPVRWIQQHAPLRLAQLECKLLAEPNEYEASLVAHNEEKAVVALKAWVYERLGGGKIIVDRILKVVPVEEEQRQSKPKREPQTTGATK